MRQPGSPNSFLLTLFGFEKATNKAHILLVILVHALGWCIFFFLPVLLYPVRFNDNRFVMLELVDKAILVVFFYLNYYLLIPRFFEKKKYLAYFSLIILLFLVYMVQRVAIRSNYFPRPGGPFQLFVQRPAQGGNRDSLGPDIVYNSVIGVSGRAVSIDSIPPPPGVTTEIAPAGMGGGMMTSFRFPEEGLFGIPKSAWLITLNNAISSFAVLLLMGGFIRLAYSFIRNQNEKKALENANLNAEVNFLKSQINPHFLFNTLNSIYAQAHSRSDNTEFSILKLSELLRYVLYDSGENKVELAKDIQYINNYIDLQTIRLSSKVKINYVIKGGLKNYMIAPLLLITFIENAFKHGISYTHASTVNIEIHVFEETLTLLISNPVVERNSFAPGGLGLKNVTRRLDLLYPGKYLLDIHHDDYLHVVNLKLDLKSD
jgi:two-component system, LytTR family, sensor kinase